MDFTRSEISAYYSSRVPSLKQHDDAREWRGKCPVHNGEDDNFAVDPDTGRAYCHSRCQQGWDILGLEMAVSELDFPTSKKSVFRIVGRNEPTQGDCNVVSTFDYLDVGKQLLYQAVRRFPKKFSLRRPGPNNRWIYNMDGIERIPFQLPRLITERVVFVVEGEQDALTLTKKGLFATCNSEGAGKWRPGLAQWFKGKQVFIIPDNDRVGREHALKVAASLKGVASVVRIVEIPGLAVKGDVSDFFALGHSVEELRAIVSKSRDYSEDFRFEIPLPEAIASSQQEDDAEEWVSDPAAIVREYGGVAAFWDLAADGGIPTPFSQLNRELSGGLKAGEIYTIAGEQASGKTSLLLQFISRFCRNGVGCLFFSLEMGHKDVLRRLISIEQRVDLLQLYILQQQLKEKSISLKDESLLKVLLQKLHRGTSPVENYPLLVHQNPSITTRFIIDETQRLEQRQKIDVVCIDHAQLLASVGRERSNYEKFCTISRTLKREVARLLNKPILLLSQVNRQAANEGRTELELRDLRDGPWAEDAATTLLLYPDANHVKSLRAAGKLDKGPVQTYLKVGKNRYGSQPVYIKLLHYKGFTRFESYDERDYEPDTPVQPELGAA